MITIASTLGWLHVWPTWVLLMLILGSITISWWTYHGLSGALFLRITLALLRAGTLVFILLLLLGPVLETQIKHHTPDQVLVLLDRSASMSTEDEKVGGQAASRDSRLHELIRKNQSTWEQVGSNRSIRWIGFHEQPFTLLRGEDGLPTIPPPTGLKTDIPRSIAHVLERRSGEPTSSIILLSDGRSNTPPPPGHLQSLRTGGVPIISIPLGSTDISGDLSIHAIQSPTNVYPNDQIPVTVQITFHGDVENTSAGSIILEDMETGSELDNVPIPPAPGNSTDTLEVTLFGKPTSTTGSTWRVLLDLKTADLISTNNSKIFTINLITKPLRVLYIEGKPRWEYRYLKNLLLREPTITSSTMLLSADSDFVQEGDRPLSRLPSSHDEFKQWDIIIIGDVPATTLTPEQATIIRDQVGEGMLALIWIGGQNWTPSTWGNSRLADLLPMVGPLQVEASSTQFHIQPTETAGQLGILQIEDGGSLFNPSISWSALRWKQHIPREQIKPATELLATSNTTHGDPVEETWPLLLSMRYGGGRVVYAATDEFWRWRHGHGERLYEQFWIQLLRSMSRNKSADGSRARLTLSHNTPTVQQAVRMELHIMDSTEPTPPDSPHVLMFDESGQQIDVVTLVQSPADESRFTGTWLPERAGFVRAQVEYQDPAFNRIIEQSISVVDPSSELHDPSADHEALSVLSSTSQGTTLFPDAISELPSHLPDRSITTMETRQKVLWDSPWLLLIPSTLLILEWLGRRLMRMA